MSLRLKILLATGCAMLMFAGFGVLLRYYVIMPSFLNLERREAERNVGRVVEALKREVKQIEPITKDWGIWDASYQYMLDRNETFAQENLEQNPFEGPRLDILQFYDTNQHLVWGHLYDRESKESAEWGLKEAISAQDANVLLRHEHEESLHSGVVLTSEGPLLVSSVPMVTGSKKGPIVGALIMGRRLDAQLEDVLRLQTSVTFRLHLLDAVADDPRLAGPVALLRAGETIHLDMSDQEVLRGYTLLADISNRPVMLFEVVTPRTISKEGDGVARLFFILFFSGGLALLLMLLIMMRQLITAPLAQLTRFAATFGVTQVVTASPPALLNRGDEIGGLTRTFERMMEQLNHSRVEMMEARDQAVQASAAKSLFLAQMSHEIRTPMNGVLGMLELLSQSTVSREQRYLLEDALSSAESLLAILNDILDFAKIESGRLPLEQSDFDLLAVLERVVRLSNGRATAKGIALSCYAASTLPERVRGDALRLGQVLTNLLNNAVKFTREGEIFLGCGVEERDARGYRLRFHLHDTGVGIPKAARARLFQPFVQADETVAGRHGGTGLGLAICAQILQLMNGEIVIEDNPGGGTIFSFTVRVGRAVEGDEGVGRALEQQPRVLLLDRLPTSRMIALAHLLALGARPDLATSLERIPGLLAAARTDNDPFAYVILEKKLLRGPGLVLVQAMMQGGRSKGAPRLLLLADNDDMGEEEGLERAQVVRRPLFMRALYRAMSGAEATPLVEDVGSALQGRLRGTVLLVDDQVINQRVAGGLLTWFGVRCEIASDGGEAVAAWERGAFDLIFMDLRMPGMDGSTATRMIRKLEAERSKPRTPIVAMTADAAVEARLLCEEAGMDGFITKPVRKNDLSAMLQRWLALHVDAKPVLVNDSLSAVASEASLAASLLSVPQGVLVENLEPTVAMPDDWSPERLNRVVFAELHGIMGTEFTTMCDQFITTTMEQIQTMWQALHKGDAVTVGETAHAMKGNSRILGGTRFGEMCSALQDMGRSGNLEGVDRLLTQAAAEFLLLQRLIEKACAEQKQ